MTVQAIRHVPGNPPRSSRHGWAWVVAIAGGMAVIAIAAVGPAVSPGSGTGHYH